MVNAGSLRNQRGNSRPKGVEGGRPAREDLPFPVSLGSRYNTHTAVVAVIDNSNPAPDEQGGQTLGGFAGLSVGSHVYVCTAVENTVPLFRSWGPKIGQRSGD